MYRIQTYFMYGWDFVNDEVYDTYNEAIADLNEMLLTAVDDGLDMDPDQWRVVEIPQGQPVAP